MLETLSRTQVRAEVIPSQIQENPFKSIKEFVNNLSTVAL